jgi:hypothetical protein
MSVGKDPLFEYKIQAFRVFYSPHGLLAPMHWLAATDLARRHPSIDLVANALYVASAPAI